MTSQRTALRPTTATLASFACAGWVEAFRWAFETEVTAGVRLEAAAFDLAHFLAVGLVCAALVRLAELWPVRFARGRRALFLLGVTVLSLSLGALTLPEDFENFAGRQQAVAPELALWGGAGLVSFAVPSSVAVGWLAGGRWRRSPWTELAALVLLLAVVVLNGIVLPNDYRGIHLYLALTAIAFAASTWSGSLWPKRFARSPRPAFVLVGLAAAASLVLEPSASTFLALERSTSAVISPLVSDVRGAATHSTRDVDAAARAAARSNPWLRSRKKAPAIPPSKPPVIGAKPLVILITVDALRADVVAGKYDAKLPVFAKLRKRAVWFPEARAAGTLTKVSLTALFMSTHFSQQYWTETNGAPHPRLDKTKRFPELLRTAGVKTLNFRAITWLRNGAVVKGFAENVDPLAGKKRHHYYTPAKDIFGALLPRVEHIGPEPAFVWTHLADPHAPYDLAGRKGSDFERYLGEVALVDGKLGELFDLLDETGLADRTLVIISADHGEAFGEHRSRTHGTTVYDEGLRVPLFLVPPKSWQGTPRQIDQLATTLDIAPTVLDVFGLPTPGHMMGQSLVPFLRDQNPKLERPIVAEARQFRTLVTPDRWKVIVDLRKNRSELYDLKADPLEKNDLSGNADAPREPRAMLDAFFAAHELKRAGYKRLIVR